MREIKFRAWHKEDKRFIDLNGFEIAFKGFRNQGAVTDVVEQGNLSMIDVDDVELLQYTGLKDKNGVEIYEGDILNSTSYIGGNYLDTLTDKVVVSFHNYKWAIQPVKRNLLRPQPITELEDDCEVIGNIYENPELLGK